MSQDHYETPSKWQSPVSNGGTREVFKALDIHANIREHPLISQGGQAVLSPQV